MFSGLLDLLDSQDELASVLAHEVAHVLARHQGERLSRMNMLYIGEGQLINKTRQTGAENERSNRPCDVAEGQDVNVRMCCCFERLTELRQ